MRGRRICLMGGLALAMLTSMDRRTYPEEPIVGVGAVVFRDRSVLVIKRGNPPLSSAWSLPGGRVNENESLPEATSREVKEECDIGIEIVDLITLYEYIERDGGGLVKYHYTVFDFAARYVEGELRALTDALDARWIEIDTLDRCELTDAARRIIREGYERVSGT